ncbi:hypothetical protein TNCV_2262421 [Trichonephila clavipes]|nr:hypothetical protein TNCV_2262421 [Trichonephila clavipes]
MIAASQLSSDEYAMRIATQTESALICKEYSSPFIADAHGEEVPPHNSNPRLQTLYRKCGTQFTRSA